MKTVCEVVVTDILPTLRAAIAKELINSYNMNQGEAAKLLNVSQPAVSQYLRQLRGKADIVSNEQVMSQVKEISGLLYSNKIEPSELGSRMCLISKSIIQNGFVKEKLEDCTVCE